jgi:hypothetical protein
LLLSVFFQPEVATLADWKLRLVSCQQGKNKHKIFIAKTWKTALGDGLELP